MKRHLKQTLLSLLTSHPVTSITDRLFNCGVPIFMLHRMTQQDESDTGKISATHLRNCLEYLSSHNYKFLSLENLIQTLKDNQKPPPKSVVFTMDDGYIDQAEIAAPVFLEYNCPVTFFVITGMLSQDIWPWDAKVAWIIESSKKSTLVSCAVIKNLGLKFDKDTSKRELRRAVQLELKKMNANAIANILQQLAANADLTIPDKPPPAYQSMTWDMARQLEEKGIQFAPHSVSHNILSKLGYEVMEEEVQQAWLTIKNELRDPLKVFCYPNGRPADFGEREVEAIKNFGYLGATSTTPNTMRYKKISGDQIYSLPRLPLPNNMTDLLQNCSWIENFLSCRN